MSDIEIIDCAQGSSDWFAARAGAVTASMFSTVRDTLKSGPNKGGYKKAAEDYAFRLAVERISGSALQDEQFQTYAMRRGNELEPDARAIHEFRTGCTVETAGMVRTTDRKFGASVDGLVGDDGISEYKCFVAPEKLKTILIDNDISGVTDQIQGGLWLTGRQWCDFALYCPALASIDCELTVRCVYRDDDYIEAMEHDLLAFDELVESFRMKLTECHKAL
jgi:hypothetical protein